MSKHSDFIRKCEETACRVDQLRRAINEILDALEFYADEKNWVAQRGHPQIDAHDTAVNEDKGERARAALRQMGEELRESSHET